MVKGETGTLSLDVRTSVDKGVSTFVSESVSVCVRTMKGTILTIRSEIRLSFLSSFGVLLSILVLSSFVFLF